MEKTHFLVFVLAMSFIVMDPFKWGPLGGRDFRPVRNDIAPYDEVMGGWPWDNRSRLGFGNLEFKDDIFGPESLEFDRLGRGPYAGLADGRVVRSEKECAQAKDSTTKKQWKVEPKCGRPLGLRFDKRSGELYIADAYYGLLVVGPDGGLATQVATQAGGEPILFANDLDIHDNGSIFFTDTSNRYNRVDHFFILLEGEATGRLLRYDPQTRTTHVILKGLAFPNGVQLSQDQSYLLYTETTNCRIMKHMLMGPKAGSTEVVANLPGFPDNIRITETGDFWVAIDCCRTAVQEVFVRNPWLRSLYFRVPLPMKYLARVAGMRMYTMISLINGEGEILDVLDDEKGVVMKLVSEVREVNGKLWIGTVAHNHIATLQYPPHAH
ncbi:calcium-dependent phosphotriesterase superfamily protein [Striga asiatica]|uniref:Calcium-dependent phosphotriesterase superfamily protein n=1 Tax=Striga asiatica TaxID=4170 RepID=A0A5A7PIN4_STRAF|nr:calcium-dependent phosphotriesterase superfamily protein [Striga asiatica]